jgi:hypothetical protein
LQTHTSTDIANHNRATAAPIGFERAVRVDHAVVGPHDELTCLVRRYQQ